ncbi:MAG: hypothetical protein V4773_16230 [Verrucomicrobiota bacterium]
MNCLPTTATFGFPLSSTPARRATFRFPREMHVPAKAIVISFEVIPEASWLTKSFRTWISGKPIPQPVWMR